MQHYAMTKRPHFDDGKPETIDESAGSPDAPPFRDEAVTDGVIMHWPESEKDEMTLADSRSGAPSKVKGPIRCHKCQLKCRDADHYLRHKCEPRRRKT
jgi:hypothetical protein